YSLEDNLNYEVEVATARNAEKAIKEFNLIIFHQLPSTNYPLVPVFKQIQENNIPVLFVLGSKTDFNRFSALNFGTMVKPSGNSFQDALAASNTSFTFYKIDESFVSVLPKLPPLKVPFGEYRLGN